MVEVRLSTEADADILDILTKTYADFGGDALLRYECLIVTAFSDLAVLNWRHGVVSRPELGPGIHSYHLRHSRDRARHLTGIVRRPRHFILYRHTLSTCHAGIDRRWANSARCDGFGAPSAVQLWRRIGE